MCQVVSHLQREISIVKKFMPYREESLNAEVTSNHYRRFPLVQGGVEKRCKTSIKLHPFFNEGVFVCYKNIVKELYNKLMEEELLASLLLEKTIPTNWCNNSKKEKDPSICISSSEKAAKAPQSPTKSKDIRGE